MTGPKFDALFGGPARTTETPVGSPLAFRRSPDPVQLPGSCRFSGCGALGSRPP